MTAAAADFEIVIDRDAAMTTADGVQLTATVYRLAGAAPAPALLMRTPYGKDIATNIHLMDPMTAVRAGFVVIVQDVRGRYTSGGVWRPYEQDAADGYAAVQWAASLPFCNGVVGMYGASYQGAVLLAAAALRPPALRSIAPMLCWRDPAEGQTFRGGALELGKLLRWTLMNMPDRLERRIADRAAAKQMVAQVQADLAVLDIDDYSALPLGRLPLLEAYDPESEIFDYMRSADAGDLNAPAMIPPGQWHDVPALWIAGWYDSFLGDMIRGYETDRARGLPAELIIAPWTHADHSGRSGEIDFGPEARMIGVAQQPLETVLLDWFTDTLKGERTPAPVQVFAMGADEWREAPVFPPADSTPLALHLTVDGGLSQTPPAEGALAYVYDPADPVPTVGGPTLMGGNFPAGPRDQSALSARPDVLTFKGPILDRDVTVADWVTAELWVESSAPATDFVARLLDMAPDGRSIGVADGVARVALTPGAGPTRVDIDLWCVHQTFKVGHRIGVQVTSSSFPRWSRNLNTGAPLATGADPAPARQTLRIGADHPSKLRVGR